MSRASPSILPHKLSQGDDVKFLRAMLKVEGWLPAAGTSPSLNSAMTQFCRVAEMLTSGDAISEQDVDGNTALHRAFLELGDGLLVDLLMGKYLQETTRNLTNGDGLSFLHIVCTRPYVDVLKRVLMDGQADVDCKVDQRSSTIYPGYTPLHFAVKFDQREVAELLLARHNANLNEQDARRSTPLHLALECGNFPMVDLLLANDRKRENVVNDQGWSHFMAACAGQDEHAVAEYLRAAPALQLLNATVDHDAGHRFAGYTPLRFALAFGRASTARLLMDRGAADTTSSGLSGSADGDDSTSSCSGFGRGKRNVCAESLCFMFEVFAWALFLMLLLPSLLM